MLQKDNVVLRAPEPADVDFLFRLENDRRFWQLSNTLAPFSRFDLEQYILQAEKDVFAARQVRFMIDKTRGEKTKTIGTVDLFEVEPKHRRAGLGIMLIETEREKGLASKALDILTDYAFSVLNLHQLYCNIESGNTNSLRLFESKGFEVTGKKCDWNLRDGKWTDEFILQLIRKENV